MTRFMVQWADHPSHLATRLGQLLEHQTLVDVTLMCNTHTLRVHRAVLAAGSPYFETILQRQLGQHPLIVLKDMQFTVLKCLIEFMYCGETSVTEDNLPALLQAAKFFQVRGLSAMTKEALGLTTGPEGTAVNGAGDAGTVPSVQLPQKSFSRAPKRVNIESKPAPSRQRPALKPRTIPAETQANLLQSAAGPSKPRTIGTVGDSPRMTFHTIPKTVPTRPLASRSSETQADNARLLLSLAGSDNFQAKPAVSTPPTTVLGRPRQSQTPLANTKNAASPVSNASKNIRFHHDVSGIIPPKGSKMALHEGVNRVISPPKRRGRPPVRNTVPKTLTPALKLALENQAKNKALPTTQSVLEKTSLPVEFVEAPEEEPAPRTTLYRDPNTNILYEMEDTPPVVAEGLETVEAETVIYQLPDGTITDKDGNAIMDEDGNPQNILNYQVEGAGGQVMYQVEGEGEEEGNVVYQMEGVEETEAEETEGVVESEGAGEGEAMTHSQYMDVLKKAGLPTDMPILLDNGDGNYVAVDEEVLRNIVDGGVLQCQVTEGNLVREDGEEYLVGPEAELEAVDSDRPSAVDEMHQQHDTDSNLENGEFHESLEDKDEMPIVGKSLPSLDDEEVITGDVYEDMGFHQDNVESFPAQEEADGVTDDKQTVEHSEFEYESKECADKDTDPPISVEQALEEMMGGATEGAEDMETVSEQNADLLGDRQSELDNLQNVLNSSMESNTEKSTFQGTHNSVLIQGDDSSVTNQTEDSFVIESEPEDCPSKTSSLLTNALRESGIVSEGDTEENLEREESLDKLNSTSIEENSTESSEDGSRAAKEVVYEITGEDGEKRIVTISGETVLLPDEGTASAEGASLTKDIPFAVGLLPLQDALEQLQSIPDHQPRKTRSSDQAPAAGNKRKASADSDVPEKRPRPADEPDPEDVGTDDTEASLPEFVESGED